MQKNAHSTTARPPKNASGSRSFLSLEKHASTAMNSWKNVTSSMSLYGCSEPLSDALEKNHDGRSLR